MGVFSPTKANFKSSLTSTELRCHPLWSVFKLLVFHPIQVRFGKLEEKQKTNKLVSGLNINSFYGHITQIYMRKNKIIKFNTAVAEISDT